MTAPRYIGARVPRNEDARLLTGRALFVDDVEPPGTLHVAFYRSDQAHARLRNVDPSAARRRPGVVAVYTAWDLGEYWRPGPLLVPPPPIPGLVFHQATQVPLARDKVRHVGEPIAMVVAESRYLAEDALDDIRVELDPLPAVVDLEAALRPGAPLVHDQLGTNLAAHVVQRKGDYQRARRKAAVVIRRRLFYDRGAAAAIENRAVVASWDPRAEELTVWDTTQAPIPIRNGLARLLGLLESQVRVVAPFVGGGFGPKIMMVYPEEVLVPWAAIRLGRPVKWAEDRRENFYATTQERGQIHDAEIALTRDGRILGVRDVFLHDTGAYDPYGLTVPINTQCTLLGPYDIPHYYSEFRAVFTNKTIVTPVRGAGRQHGVFVIERLLDAAARELGLDPAEIRRRNFLPRKAFPHNHQIIFQDSAPLVYDSGDYLPALERAQALIGYEQFRRTEQPALRAAGRHVGIGIVTYVEGTGIGPYEGARVTVEPSGRVRVATGVGTQGQGHLTALAQIVAEVLDVPVERVHVITGDTREFHWGTGTFASRGAVVAGSACYAAAARVREKILGVAGRVLGADPKKIELRHGTARVRGEANPAIPIGQLALQANPLRGAVRPGSEPGLEATAYFGPDKGSTANGVHAMIVEVDPETAQVEIRRYVVVHDCGRLINPLIVEGQIQGGVAHGIGNAFYERLIYDDNGQLLNASLMDYLLPTALDVPRVEMDHRETPSPFNPAGIKGVGEAGAIPAAAVFAQAVEDALADIGLEITEIPLSPNRLFELIEDARRGRAAGPIAAPAGGRALVVEGRFEFAGPREAVWDLLLDPAVLRQAMPGAELLERAGADGYRGVLKVGIGPITASQFALTVSIVDPDPPRGYALRVDARGPLGFVAGVARVTLTPGASGGTDLSYRAELEVGGTIAAVGQRLLESASRVMTGRGLAALNRELAARLGGSGR
ncbi:MAG TPA: molybdopterin cofactor-binding domain-containing protein [Gemmatimonadales bacterium]|nr:molybdopterin cofactor-binding domain-containing protein [Gemmatimonadales bacterium]